MRILIMGDSTMQQNFASTYPQVGWPQALPLFLNNKVEILNFARECNKYIDTTTPWAIAKDESKLDLLKTILYNLAESIRFIATMLLPIIPQTAKKILNQILKNY